MEDHLEKARLKWEASESSGGVHFFSMFVTNFGSLVAVPIGMLEQGAADADAYV